METFEPGPVGYSFRNARQWAWENETPDTLVVHGSVFSESVGKRIEHAWVEQGGDVIDPTTGVRMPRARWYELLDARADAGYRPKQIYALLVRTEHGGPYTETEDRGRRVFRNPSRSSYPEDPALYMYGMTESEAAMRAKIGEAFGHRRSPRIRMRRGTKRGYWKHVAGPFRTKKMAFRVARKLRDEPALGEDAIRTPLVVVRNEPIGGQLPTWSVLTPVKSQSADEVIHG